MTVNLCVIGAYIYIVMELLYLYLYTKFPLSSTISLCAGSKKKKTKSLPFEKSNI